MDPTIMQLGAHPTIIQLGGEGGTEVRGDSAPCVGLVSANRATETLQCSTALNESLMKDHLPVAARWAHVLVLFKQLLENYLRGNRKSLVRTDGMVTRTRMAAQPTRAMQAVTDTLIVTHQVLAQEGID